MQRLEYGCPRMCRFFEDYKRNEHKEVKVDEILGQAKALEIIKAAMVGDLPPTQQLSCCHEVLAGWQRQLFAAFAPCLLQFLGDGKASAVHCSGIALAQRFHGTLKCYAVLMCCKLHLASSLMSFASSSRSLACMKQVTWVNRLKSSLLSHKQSPQQPVNGRQSLTSHLCIRRTCTMQSIFPRGPGECSAWTANLCPCSRPPTTWPSVHVPA